MFHLLALAEESRHYKGVRKSDLDAIDDGIARALDNGEDIMVGRVTKDRFDG